MTSASPWSGKTLRRSIFALAAFPFLGVWNAEARVTVLESTSEHLLLEIVPEPAKVQTVHTEARDYVRLSIPGFGETSAQGRPEVPVGSVRFAIPPGTKPTLRVLEESWSERYPGAVVPVGERIGVRERFGVDRVIEKDPREEAVYLEDDVFPREPFSITGSAGLRFQRVASVVFYGAKAEVFARSHRFLVRARLEIQFEADDQAPRRAAGTRPAPRDELWERTSRGTLLNADVARGWAMAGRGDGTTVGDTPWGAGNQWKILVTETGIAEVTYESLAASGFPAGQPVDLISAYQRSFDLNEVDDPSTPASALFVSNPVPIQMVDADTDGFFGPGDSFRFYGRSVRDQYMTSGFEHEDVFSTDNFVWLRIGPETGARMIISRPGGSLSGAAVDSLASTPDFVFGEDDVFYYERPPDFGEGRRAFESEFYFRNSSQSAFDESGWLLKTATTPYEPVNVIDPVPGTAGTLTLRVLGGGRPVDSFFTTKFETTINDHVPLLGTKTFLNSNLYVGNTVPPANVLHTFPIPAGILVPGENRLTFRGWSYHGVSNDLTFVTRFFFDWYRIHYNRQLLAHDGRLALSTSNGSAAIVLVRVRGFAGQDVLLYDVNNPANPLSVGVDPSQVVPDGGAFALRFDHDNSTAAGSYVAIRAAEIPEVPSSGIALVPQPTILQGGTGARYIALAHDSLLPGAQALAAYRAGTMSSIAAPLSQVWDVFNNGRRDPRAIKAYITYAFHRWSTPVSFLCLIGDASEDHRGVTADADPDLMPSHSLWASYEGAPEETDQYYAEVTRGVPADPDGFDDTPDLYVGRLALNTPEELDWNLQRIEEYESPGAEDDTWRRHVLFVADDAFSGDLNANATNGYDFRLGELEFRNGSNDYADSVSALPFDAVIADRLYLGHYTMTCPDSCYDSKNCPPVCPPTQYTDDCENGLGRDCGFWYECRMTIPQWVERFTCLRQLTRAAVLPELRKKLNLGTLMWNFQGHANKYFLTHEEIFRDDPLGGARDAQTLENEGMPFIFLGFACHLAEFDNADEARLEDSISEKLMNVRPFGQSRPAGAIGAFSSSGFEFLGPNIGFNEHLIEAFFHPERTGDLGTLPDSPGPDPAYTWTLGESTTRARILYQNDYPFTFDEDNRQAAQRFILLGDPALQPDIGEMSVQVTMNGATVTDGEFIEATGAQESVEFVATISHGRGVGAVRIFDSQLGEVPASALQIGVADSTTDGVARRKTVTYTHALRKDTYQLTIQAANERGAISDFTINLSNQLKILDVTPYPNPFSNELVLHYVLTTAADEVRVRLYTVAGRKIFESKSAPTSADVNAFVWDGKDDGGNSVANGTYLLHLKASGPGGDAETHTRVVKMH